jgi:hypothetical protein
MFILLSFILAEILFFSSSLQAQPTESLNIIVGSEFTIENGGSNIRQFPFLSVSGNDVFVSFSQHVDSYVKHPTDGIVISTYDSSSQPTIIQNPDFYLTSLIKLNSGTLFGLSYISYWIDARHATAQYTKSTDNGVNWIQHTGTVTFSQDIRNLDLSGWSTFVFHRSILEMPDGSIQGIMYGKYDSDDRYRSIWVKSTDSGVNWTVVSTIACNESMGGGGNGYEFCEPVVVRCADSSLLCIMRVLYKLPLYQSRSIDNGVTWSKPVVLPGIDTASTYNSVDPDLCLMSNGILVLSYGRPNCRMLFSLDGNGNKWEYLTSTYATKSSGYTGIREIAPNRLMLIGDKGANGQSPSSYVIWGKYIDVKRTSDEIIPVTGITVTPDTASIAPGADLTLSATVTPANATDKSYEWSSSSDTIATINSSGKVTGVKAGTCKIFATATVGSKTISCAINVSVFVTCITISPAKINIDVGMDTMLRATVDPADATNKTCKWSSSDATIAKVDKTGNVTGLKTGNARIFATTIDGGFMDYCDVTVALSTSMEYFSKSQLSIYPNPANDYISIMKTVTEPVQIQISDVYGLKLIEENISDNIVNIQSLLPGSYIIKVNCDSYKFIKQ